MPTADPTNSVPREISRPQFSLLEWLRLMRISAAPSAVSNILVGYLLANQEWQPTGPLLLLIASSVALYVSGMISNDVFDRTRDASTNPNRPLVAGTISVRSASIGYIGLMLTGVLLATMVGLQSALISVALVVCILIYNSVLKSTPVAPIVMGICRLLNILLGASFVSASTVPAQWSMLHAPNSAVWWIGVSLAVLITGLTYFARRETQTNSRLRLSASTMVILAGLIGFSTVIYAEDPPARNSSVYMLMILLISLPIGFRYFRAIMTCQPREIVYAIVALLRSLIVLDAAVCFWVGQGETIYALIVLSLLLPATLLGKWISAT